MSASEFDRHKVDHLFLLMGENPLPNYVAAKTLLKEKGTIYLVHSTATASRADSLRRMLKPVQVQLVSLHDKQANVQFIRNKIQETIKGILQTQPDAQMGLNYTGGTKAMAVHAYRAMSDAPKSDAPNLRHLPIFSYLDSESLQILINREDNLVHTETVTLNVSLKELFALHNLPWREERQPRFEPILPSGAKGFLDFYLISEKQADLRKQWNQWRSKVLHSNTKKGADWKPEEELKSIEALCLKIETLKAENECKKTEIIEIPEQLKQVLDSNEMLDKGKLSIQYLRDNKGFDLLKDVCAWLDGTWLENYILWQVKNLPDNCLINRQESAMSFHIRDQDSDKDENKFELDVAFMRHYQLFAISCTTENKKSVCKQKLFEAYIRARQLGGDEARVALVCFNETPDKIKQDLTPILGENKFIVFGLGDLKPEKLSKKLTNWVLQNSSQS